MNKNKWLSTPVVVAIIILLAALIAAGVAASHLFSLIQEDVTSRLNTALVTSINRVKQSFTNHQRNSVYWAENTVIQQIALLANKHENRAMQQDLYQLVDGSLKATITNEGYRDYKLFNLNGELILSGISGFAKPEKNITLPDNILAALSKKDVYTSHPFMPSSVWQSTLRHQYPLPTMLFIAPIHDWAGKTVAFFAFEINPDKLFNPAFHENQVGQTGQAYAIDEQGRMLTQSKFTNQLIRAGLIDASNPLTELKLEVRDPGFDLLESPDKKVKSPMPLTLMAKSLTQHKTGVNLKGYRDYRGVKVIGSWRWDEQLNMGIVTETEVSEVYKLYRSLLFSVIVSIVFIIFMTAFGTYFYRRSTQQQIVSLQQRDAIIKQTDDGFVTIDDQGRITMVNPAICLLFGYQEAELIGQPVSILIDEEQRHKHDNYLKQADIHEPKIIHRTRSLSATRKDGSQFPIELNVSPMQFGHRKFYIGVIRDISERYQYQQELIKAMQQAEHANQAKSEFLAKMSHELRTPLNAIIGFSQLLQMDKLNDDQRESVSMIESSGNHLLSLINEVLDLSRIESGHMSVSVEDVELKPLIEHILPFIHNQLSALDLRITESYPTQSSSLFVRADHIKLKQVLLNLLSNAAKYNKPSGSIEIIVSHTDSDSIRIAIKDTGYGIDENLQQRLFEPFDRLDKDTSDIQGTGIGLVISRELIKLMNGRFGFESKRDIGSTFWIELQRSSVNNSSILSAANNQSDQLDGEQTQHIKVLCIEDNPTNLNLMQRFFKQYPQFILLTAADAESGLEIARQFEPQVILMDINLPGKNGFEALKDLKRSAITRDIKTIALSANAMREDIDRGLKAGFDYYLTKPLNFELLIETINQAIEKSIKH
ncbi:PAS domain S-box protein [Methylophaga thalassica]|uniref:PAS domain S-box protein n=1 Tax=Methylophaga aminisulfidivorans TaxID=230105 RepID=UPI0024E225F7|nr:PAS domain S-box protein [Methylophaga aminisulfidivorans]